METYDKFSIYPPHEQHNLTRKTFGCYRYAYCCFLAEQAERIYKSGRNPVARFEQDEAAHDAGKRKRC
ncbi:MAG: helix-turn-helix domain-containing protein [Spirochaetaceae bacterium]|nr:helix-turn-helix domain-containing protein [Spirochaetaceae bacterium]